MHEIQLRLNMYLRILYIKSKRNILHQVTSVPITMSNERRRKLKFIKVKSNRRNKNLSQTVVTFHNINVDNIYNFWKLRETHKGK